MKRIILILFVLILCVNCFSEDDIYMHINGIKGDHSKQFDGIEIQEGWMQLYALFYELSAENNDRTLRVFMQPNSGSLALILKMLKKEIIEEIIIYCDYGAIGSSKDYHMNIGYQSTTIKFLNVKIKKIQTLSNDSDPNHPWQYLVKNINRDILLRSIVDFNNPTLLNEITLEYQGIIWELPESSVKIGWDFINNVEIKVDQSSVNNSNVHN